MINKMRSFIMTLIGFVAVLTVPVMAFADTWYQYCRNVTNRNGTFYKTMQEYLSINSCWFCDLFVTKTGNGGLFVAINNLVTTVYNELASDFILLLGVGILFVILFKVAKILVSLQEVDVIQFLQDLFKPLGRAIIASTLLAISIAAGQDTIFSMIVNPVLDVSLELGRTVMETSLKNQEYSIVKDVGETSASRQWQRNRCKLAKVGAAEDKAFGKDEGQLMRCWMEQVANSFIVGIALGGSMMSVAVSGSSFFDWGFSLWLCGLVIWGSFYILYLMFPMKVIDAFVRLAFVLTLAPLWITLWVFPATVQYTKKAWDMFLSACLMFAILGIMIALVIQIMDGAIPDIRPAGAGNTLRKGLIACMKSGNDKGAITWVPFGGGAILNCLAFAAVSFTLLGAASTLANTFVGGGGDLGIGNSIAGLAARGGAVAWAGAKAAGKGSMVVGGAVASGTGKAMGALNRGARWLGTPAQGARASALNRFFAGLGKERSANPLNAISNFADRLKNGPSAGGSAGDTAQAGVDYGRLTEGARNDVDQSVARDESAMAAALKNGNNMSLRGNKEAGAILGASKTARERAIKEDMMRTMEKGATGRGKDKVMGMPTDAQRQALKDELARQKMAENAMNEQAHADRVKQEQASAAKKAGQKEARDFLGIYGSRARSEAEIENIKNNWCKTDAERAVMDKFFKDTNRSRAALNFEEEWGKVKAEQAKSGVAEQNKPTDQSADTPKQPETEGTSTPSPISANQEAVEAEERRKEAARHAAEAAAREGTREQQADRMKEELAALKQTTGRLSSALSDLQTNSKSRASVQDLHANMAFIEQQVQGSRSREELESKLAGHQWQFSGDASMKDSYATSMSSMAQDLWSKKETGDTMSVENVIKRDISDCLNKYGSVSESDVLARHVASYSVNDVMDGNSSAITSRLGRLLNK